MKVFKIVPTKNYCHGCAIVAADTAEQAKKFYLDYDEFNQFLFDDCNCKVEEIKDLEYHGDDIVLIDTIVEE